MFRLSEMDIWKTSLPTGLPFKYHQTFCLWSDIGLKTFYILSHNWNLIIIFKHHFEN